MSAAHTPGPWHVSFTKFSQVKAANGALVATCNKLEGLVNLQANARLIASAPDLLDVLERAVRRLEIAHANGDSIMREWIVDARAVVAKATGEGA